MRMEDGAVAPKTKQDNPNSISNAQSANPSEQGINVAGARPQFAPALADR